MHFWLAWWSTKHLMQYQCSPQLYKGIAARYACILERYALKYTLFLWHRALTLLFFNKAHCCVSVHCYYWPGERGQCQSYLQVAEKTAFIGLLCYGAPWTAFLQRRSCDWSYKCLFLLCKCKSPFFYVHSLAWFCILTKIRCRLSRWTLMSHLGSYDHATFTVNADENSLVQCMKLYYNHMLAKMGCIYLL